MNKPSLKKSGPAELSASKRKGISAAQDELVTEQLLRPDQPLPLVMQPILEGLDLVSWGASNRELIQARLLTHGGVLFRGFAVRGPAHFEQFVEAVAGEPLVYQERSSPRSQVSGKVYTSTDHPPDQSIFLHNEQSYNLVWPLNISFCCALPAQQGGETPIADCRRVLQHLDPRIVERFRERQYMYVRNFGDGFGLSWQTAFQTTEKAAVEAYCREHAITFEWKDGDRLRTCQVRPALSPHPRTGELLWFNHATFFHVSTLDPQTRDGLLREFREEDLPNNTYYGDGAPIEPEVLDQLRAAYARETVAFPWQQGDILILDNMIVAHARAPFVGPRKVLVAMSVPTSNVSR